MRHLFKFLIFLFVCMLVGSCGHSASKIDRYAETIFWQDEEVYAQASEELSDSELILTEAQDEAPVDSSESVVNEVTDGVEVSTEVGESPAKPETAFEEAVRKEHLRLRKIGKLHEIFNDSNHYQLAHAQRLGINPMTDIASYYSSSRPLVKIETNSDFVVDELRHSYPYLVPEAARLLHDIGRNFQDSLQSRKGGKYRIIVTSVLRTPVTVKRLRRVNGNATQESTHQYGTTFDITYTRFNPAEGKDINSQEDLKNLLGEVLFDLRRKGRCLVKYERKSPCYHVTVVE